MEANLKVGKVSKMRRGADKRHRSTER